MRYRLVCFDAGFTLLSPRRTLADALSGVLTEHGHTLGEEDLRRAWEAADRWFWDEYHRPDNDTWGSDERINQTWRDYHGRIMRELGLGEAAPDVIERILASQFSPDSWEAYPDSVPTLEALQDARRDGLKIGIVSDWGSTLREIFVALKMDRYVDFVLASAAVGLAKPDPAFFRLALDTAGVSAHEAIMVGDSYRADVEGARAAGMDAVLLDRDASAGPALVAPKIRSLSEMVPIVLAASRTDADAAVPADA
ncbi:MAG: HAD family hydrolase [Candidatus Limnocylindria bacterium]